MTEIGDPVREWECEPLVEPVPGRDKPAPVEEPVPAAPLPPTREPVPVGARLPWGLTCDNCQQPLAEHCDAHLVPCCPGKCPGRVARLVAA